MSPESQERLCQQVRNALLSGEFDPLSREAVDAHLKEHPECAQWAADLVVAGHALAGRRGEYVAQPIHDSDLEAYVNGTASEELAQAVEEAGCHDLDSARRLTELRHRRARERIERAPQAAVTQLLKSVAPAAPALDALLEMRKFRTLYRAAPKAMAAASADGDYTTFQTPDGRLVVTVADTGVSAEKEAQREIEIGIRAHESQWIGSWALYRVLDANDQVAAAGFVRIEERGGWAVASVPQTEHGPYRVHVQLLSLAEEDLVKAIEEIAEQD